MKRLILWVPLAIFILFVATVAFRLYSGKDDRIQSQMVGKPLPEFTLPAAVEGRSGLSTADFKQGQPRVLNVFASWCLPCIAEAPRLLELKRRGVVIHAMAVRDRPEDIAGFLGKWGDPFGNIGADLDSAAQFALGSSGVPETFVIDGKGIIRLQHIGELREEHIPEILEAYEAAR